MKKLEQWFYTWGLRPLNVKGISLIGILLALELILKRFLIGPDFVKIGFEFIPIALIGWLFGPFWSAGIAVIADCLGAFLNGYPFFAGYTVLAVLIALDYSICFFKANPVSLWKIILAVVIECLLLNLPLGTLWVVILYKVPFSAVIWVRLIKELITIPIEIILLYFIFKNKVIQRFKFNVFM